MTIFCPSYLYRDKTPPTQNPRGKIPGAGRRVQCGAQPDEASNTLTRRPATYHHASDSRAGKKRNCANQMKSWQMSCGRSLQ